MIIDTDCEQPIPHSHQNLSCLRNGEDYSRFIGNDTAEEQLTVLLRRYDRESFC